MTAEAPDGRTSSCPTTRSWWPAGRRTPTSDATSSPSYAPGMKTIEDARHLRDGILLAFEMAELATDPVERAEWLTFVVIGAGPTGVELVGQVAELAHKVLPTRLPHREHEGGPDPAAGGGGRRARPVRREAAALHAGQAGAEMGVEVRLNTLAVAMDDGQHHRQGARRRGDHPHPHAHLGGGRAGVAAGEAARAARRAWRPTAPAASPWSPTAASPGIPRCSRSATWCR